MRATLSMIDCVVGTFWRWCRTQCHRPELLPKSPLAKRAIELTPRMWKSLFADVLCALTSATTTRHYTELAPTTTAQNARLPLVLGVLGQLLLPVAVPKALR